ncbi:hypothetical protein [Streptomyces sp. NPDC051776]|uniref:hypothetical protein n=1 Tax=Streptomyces sp. NPDC051776 TaxID=3155414 RepID=UPI0034283E53
MTPGFPPSPARSFSSANGSPSQLGRMLQPSEWADAGIPLLRNPREIVTGLHSRHEPTPSTAVVAVLDIDERVAASASFARLGSVADGWVFRNALLTQLRRIIPHDLRRRVPVRTAVLLYCREGDGQWTEEDGAWMWGLRDACTLHGLRCGAYVTLTREGWQVFGEERGGRRPHAFSQPVEDHKTVERWEATPVVAPRLANSPHSALSTPSAHPGRFPQGHDPEVPRPAAAR